MDTFSQSQLSTILTTMMNSDHKPNSLRRLVSKVTKKLDKGDCDFDYILQTFRPKPENTLKKPKNAWQLFLSEFREKLEGVAGSEQTKLASAQWKKLSSEEKEPYENRAKIESDEYKKEKEKLEGPKEIRGRGRPKKEKSRDLSLDEDEVDEEDEYHEKNLAEILNEIDQEVLEIQVKEEKKKKEVVDLAYWTDGEDLEIGDGLSKLEYETSLIENSAEAEKHRFWKIKTKGLRVLIHFGKVGKEGAFTQKTFPDINKLNSFVNSQIKTKTNNKFH
tara:strand:- start:223 stop:1050 length:828 start_codon:yes stop_codon:yes gene_type:complete